MIAACADFEPFACAEDAPCAARLGGVCADGFCAFPDANCPAGLRFGEFAGTVAGQCVVLPPGNGTTAAPTDDEDDDSETGLDPDGPGTEDDSDASDGGVMPPMVFTDDEFDGEFGDGSFNNTLWQGAVLLQSVGAGTFTSRVFDAGDLATWSDLSWTAGAPYTRALVDGASVEGGYTTGAVDMTDNVVLLHLDDATGTLSDTSGRGNDASVRTGSGESTEAIFGAGLADSDESRWGIAVDEASDLQFAESDFTWSLWINSTDSCVGNSSSDNHVYLGAEESGQDASHVWFGCLRPQAPPCQGQGGMGRAGGTIRSVFNDPDESNEFCGTVDIIDGQWHHLSLVKEGHNTTVIRVYVDGALDSEDNFTLTAPIAFAGSPDFAIGAFSNGSHNGAATFDEIAIWRRALSEAEVRALWLRGVRRMGLQVRGCTQPDCGDDPLWVSDRDGSYTDTPGAIPGTSASPNLPQSRYFQYQVQMSAALGAEQPGPRLLDVSLTATY